MRRWSGPIAVVAMLWACARGEARELVAFEGSSRPGTIVILTRQRALYFVTGPGEAIRYPVGVGKAGKQWSGLSAIDGKFVNPDWSPPREVKRDHPGMPSLIPGGSPHNPMGVRALTLSGGQYAIHGTTASMRKTVGTFASYGCIRMFNEDILDLYERVEVGTPVVVKP